MRSTALLLLLCLASTGPAGCDTSGRSGAGGLEIVSPTGREVIPREGYIDWLVHYKGERLATLFVEHRLVEREAARLGLEADEAEVERRIRADIEDHIRFGSFAGQDEWERKMGESGRTLGGFRAQRRLEHRHLLLTEGVVQRTLRFSEQRVEREWQERYGYRGHRIEARLISLEVRIPEPPEGAGQEDLRRLYDQAGDRAVARAEALRRELLDGADFGEYVERHSEDPDSRGLGGRVPGGFPPPGWDPLVVDRLIELEVDQISEPVLARGSCHLVRIDAKRVTPLEGVRDAILDGLAGTRPRAEDARALQQELLEEADWAVRETMYAPIDLHGARPREEIVLTLEGAPIARGVYGEWLARIHGEVQALNFTTMYLIGKRAAEMGYHASPEEVAARVEEDLELRIAGPFGGDRQAWLGHLEQHRRTEEAFEREQSVVITFHVQADEILIARRRIPEEEVRRSWEATYGPMGRHLLARVLRVDPELPELEPSLDRDEVRRRLAAAVEEARLRALALRQRILEGADFAGLARELSADASTREQGGLLPGGFRPALWPEEISSAVLPLQPGGTSEPIVWEDMVFVFQVIGERRVPFEDVREELREGLVNRRPTAQERSALMAELTRSVRPRALPGLYGE